MNEPIHIISLGAGVQSSTMALMAAAGEITPMPVAAIFADTQAEPKSVYNWLDWLEKQLPFPVYRITNGSLMEKQTTQSISKDGSIYLRNTIPGYTRSETGKYGMLNRSCTRDEKIWPIQRKIRQLLKENDCGKAIQWIGISLDEIMRMKPARVKYIENMWPLIDHRMTRHDCELWLSANGIPTPPKSACIMCPFHSNSQWREIKRNAQEWERVLSFEARWNELISMDKRPGQLKSKVFLHPSLKPLSEIDFSTEEERGQLNMFNNECEGMCGV